jgi:uncharacterized DUF497 family protein
MPISFDPQKREWTLTVRGLDFADAAQVIDGLSLEFVDERRDYGERRVMTIGLLNGRMTIVVWTQRGDDYHIISMRKANSREYARYAGGLDRP